MSDVKKEYEKYQKKHNLPSYDELDKEFELLYIGDIKEIKFTLRFVRRRINDKISAACNMLQSLLQPNPSSFINLQESSFFSKEEKMAYSALLRDLMQIERVSLVLDFSSDDKKEAEFIKGVYKKWLEWKEEILKITKKLVEGWKNLEIKEEKKEQYFS